MQIVEKRGGVRRILEHIGSAHTDAELAVLMRAARDRLHEGQQVLDLGLGPGVDADMANSDSSSLGGSLAGAVVVGTASQVLWDVLSDAYARLGFDAVADEAFKSLVLARIIQPTSKLAAIGVLEEIGVPAPHRNTFTAALKRCLERDYRSTPATACLAHSASTAVGRLSLVLYDCTTLYFETDTEDDSAAGRDEQGAPGRSVDPGRVVGRPGRGSRWRCTVSRVTRPSATRGRMR